MKISEAEQTFILHWGEMGSRWGINRTMAQIHALLYLSEEPLNAEQIQETLKIARSNVSMCIRELQTWGIIKVVHVLGDRRDHFASLTDVWEMFRIITRHRKQREIDPTLHAIDECITQTDEDPDLTYARERMANMRDFIQTLCDWHREVDKLSQPKLKRFLNWGAKIGNWLSRSR